jgi:hypothetical protein
MGHLQEEICIDEEVRYLQRKYIFASIKWHVDVGSGLITTMMNSKWVSLYYTMHKS